MAEAAPQAPPARTGPLPEYTPEQLRSAAMAEGRVIMGIKGKVYDLAGFTHPGGMPILKQWRGRDATKPFMRSHPWINMDSVEQFVIGRMVSAPVVLKGGAAAEAREMRGLMDAMGLGEDVAKLSDRDINQLAATAPAPTPSADTADTSEEDAAISEVFDTLCDPAQQVITPAAMKTFLERLEAPPQVVARGTAAGALNRKAFIAFVKDLDF